MIRWRGGVLQPIGGNVMLPNSATPSVPRDVLTWHDNNYKRWAAIGTTDHLYAYSFDLQTLYDITPTGVPALGPPGQPNGYGLNTYGSGLYGMPRSSSTMPPGLIGNIGDWWSMDTFGDLLLVVPTQDGHLFVWDPTTPATPATLVPEAPTNNRGVVVTDQRQAVLYGAGGDPRSVAWSDQESIHVWAPGVTNLAGSKELVTQAVAMTAVKTAQGPLIFTTNDVHLMTYVGPPYAYGIVQIGAGCGPISPRAVVATNAIIAWPSWQNFWYFSGTVAPLMCDVKDWFFAEINGNAGGNMFGSNNPQFAEVWWDFPDSSTTECNRYCAVNYAAPTVSYMSQPRPWTIGMRSRTAADRSGVLNYPVCGGLLSAWQPSTAYVTGAAVVHGPNSYTCTIGGTSAASGGPAGTTASILTTTTAAVAAGLTVIPVTSAVGMAANMPIAATGIPTGATIVSIATLNVTISAATTGTGVASGATVTVTTTAIHDGSVTWKYLAAGSGGALYQHEYGWTDNGVARASTGSIYAETGAITLGEGDQRFHVTQVVVDGVMPPGAPSFGHRFYSREQAMSPVETDSGLYSILHDGLTDVRLSGRSVRMRVEGLRDVGWELGHTRLEMKPGGRR
jgi:hypothetical protein